LKQNRPSLGSFYFTEGIISSNSRIGSFVSTMEECARVLKRPTEGGYPGAKEIIGIVVARG